MGVLWAACGGQLKVEGELAATRCEQNAQVIDIGPGWDMGTVPHLISNGSRAFVVWLASQPDLNWDGTCVTAVSPAGAHASLFVVIEMWGCSDIRLGGPSGEAISDHRLHADGSAATGPDRQPHRPPLPGRALR